jgi:hypothetical protein
MSPIEPLIWEICEEHPDWLHEAEANGVAEHLETMADFLRRKLEDDSYLLMRTEEVSE